MYSLPLIKVLTSSIDSSFQRPSGPPSGPLLVSDVGMEGNMEGHKEEQGLEGLESLPLSQNSFSELWANV